MNSPVAIQIRTLTVTESAGILLPGLFCFEHEAYDYDEDQDANDFISSIPATIEEFLRAE